MDRRTMLKAGLATGAGLLAGCLRAKDGTVDTDSGRGHGRANTFGRRRRYASTRFGEVCYVESGSGTAVLLLHGFPLNSYQWRDVMPLLSPYRRCIAPDFLGMGFTNAPADMDLRPRTQVNMLLELMDSLGIADADIIANDSGCAVAQLLLAEHSQRVRSVLLTNGDSEVECPPAAMRPVIDLARERRYAQEWLVPWRNNPELARSAKGIGAMCFAHPTNPTNEAVDTYLGPLVDSEARIRQTNRFALALESNSLQGTGPALRNCRVPVGIVWALADNIFSERGLQYLVGTLGNVQHLEYLAGYKLFWPEERPDVLAAQALRLWGY